MSDDYAQRLRAVLSDLDWSQLELVRQLAARTGNAVESERSSVRAYLSGKARPSTERARMIAEITGEDDLARIDGHRQTVAQVVDDRLEGLEAVLGSLVAGQKTILRELRKLQETLDARLPSETDATPRRRSR